MQLASGTERSQDSSPVLSLLSCYEHLVLDSFSENPSLEPPLLDLHEAHDHARFLISLSMGLSFLLLATCCEPHEVNTMRLPVCVAWS